VSLSWFEDAVMKDVGRFDAKESRGLLSGRDYLDTAFQSQLISQSVNSSVNVSLESLDLNESAKQFVGLGKKIDRIGEDVADCLVEKGYVPGIQIPSSVSKKSRKVSSITNGELPEKIMQVFMSVLNATDDEIKSWGSTVRMDRTRAYNAINEWVSVSYPLPYPIPDCNLSLIVHRTP
jgi:hypothetical protein